MTGYAEVNFDGLIGPTHNYAGLALGNVASAKNAGAVSSPKSAARQGLAKMRALLELGCVQGFLPPLPRPHLPSLRALGFTGSDRQVIEKAAKAAPDVLANVYSASSMWTANAATVAPSPDTPDGKVHFTPANLAANFHRAIEAPDTARALRHIFADPAHFVHHAPLPGGVHFGDEGAANHGRLAPEHGAPGVHLFVYGEDGERFPARQKKRASEAVARLHGLARERTVFVRQARAALDAGAFHNDVVGVANANVLFLHEESFETRARALDAIRAAAPFVEIVEAPSRAVSLDDAVSSYLFNSQLVSLSGGEMALILPVESEENPRTRAFIDEVVAANNPINRAIFLDVRESMRNGGGPACLRLRVVLSAQERRAVNQSFLLDARKIDALESWVDEHYRDRLSVEDLRDPAFMEEAFAALDALADLLGMGAFYDFQR
ncbi:N-succinylarginine dihydrolase [Amphiplicatus metriothermophilus]|uniref:N-succinylarginine dihydrolase n=1 Tax=Amphiplicatus metriothermophilus TaxID=1519374 RepID=A0A239PUU0_9PROT|nr:N-succinylarginine dihydrolase [Amphiplicatus metriothermophilus]MBB5519502.1 succinylarginine dihydrolase [Amphiplicatus metriothermophilus]SNT74069.1 succinylarginine dihydrolase [Amphiplicatus metriothermophilus]